jgi:hypothetical protein
LSTVAVDSVEKMPSSSGTFATCATPIAATNQAGYPAALPLVATSNSTGSPSSLRSAVQGFFRSAATQPLSQSSVGNAVSVSIEPIQNDKLLEKHASGILKSSRISAAEIQMVISDTYSFHNIQAILRKHQCQTNALAEHVGYDLVQEQYGEMRQMQASIYNSNKASAANNSPIPLRRRSLYTKLPPATPTRFVIDNASSSNNTSDATSPTKKDRSRSPPQKNTSSSSWDFTPPLRKRTTGTADHSDELPIHAIRDSPASVREFVKMNAGTSGRFKSAAAPLEDVANDDRHNVVDDE